MASRVSQCGVGGFATRFRCIGPLKGCVSLQITPGATFARGRMRGRGQQRNMLTEGRRVSRATPRASSGQVYPKCFKTMTKTWSCVRVDRPMTFCKRPVNVGLRFAGMLYKEMIAPGA